jgi:hypothetical protein
MEGQRVNHLDRAWYLRTSFHGVSAAIAVYSPVNCLAPAMITARNKASGTTAKPSPETAAPVG